MMSPRFAWGVVVLALVALIPTVVQNYLGLERSDSYTAASWVPESADPAAVRGIGWFAEHFGAFDAADREVTVDGERVRVSIIRSFDAKALYHHPENVIAYGKALHDHEVVALDGLPGVPVHRLKTEPSGAPLTAFYVIWWNGTFVDSPYSFQARQMATSLLRGRTPATLIFVQRAGGVTSRTGDRALTDALADVVRRLPAG